MSNQLTTPVLLLIFNRPDVTARVIESLRKVKPSYLYVSADGPRADRSDDLENCKLARAEIDKIDWPCKITKLFRDYNLGCGKGVSTGITWFFENVEAGIILEDDCVANESFFRFCTDMLNFYRDNSRIMHISGNNWQFGKKRGNSSYYFSNYSHNWGWATWRRAWNLFDYKINTFKSKEPKFFLEKLRNKEASIYWSKVMENAYYGKDDNWDAQWLYALWDNNGMSIIPKVNLVSNIGNGLNATHTSEDSFLINYPTMDLEFPLRHPNNQEINYQADNYTFKKVFRQWMDLSLYQLNWLKKIKKVFKILRNIIWK